MWKEGHNRRDCYSKREVLSIDQGELRIKLNNLENVVMLDSGAQPSIIDYETLSKLHIGYRVCPSRAHGVCATPIPTRGFVDLQVTIGNECPRMHRFVVLDSAEQTIILGRDFLKRFKSTEFDWENRRVRLGSQWLSTEACVYTY